MKKFIYLSLAVFVLASFAPASVQKMVGVKISWQFKNVVKGYDHQNKMIVYVDGNKSGESSVTKETTPNSMTVMVPKGSHRMRIENWALYEGKWELHSLENNYSHDFFWEGNVNATKKKKIAFVFDIDAGQSVKVK